MCAHPEAVFQGIIEVQQPLEAAGQRCKILIMSTQCFSTLLDEDKNINGDKRHVVPSASEDERYGSMGIMWGALIYVKEAQVGYNINAYGSDCTELLQDYPEVFYLAQDIINDL